MSKKKRPKRKKNKRKNLCKAVVFLVLYLVCFWGGVVVWPVKPSHLLALAPLSSQKKEKFENSSSEFFLVCVLSCCVLCYCGGCR